MKKNINLIKYNFKTLVGFELLYKLLSVFIFVPIFLSLFNLITKVSGYSYITLENVLAFLTNPLAFIFLLILIILITFYTFIDISTILIILDSSYQKKKIGIKEAFKVAIKKSLRVFNIHNLFLPFLVMFLIPFLNMGISSGFISTIKIPEFIMDFIKNNNFLLGLYIIFFILLAYLLYRWLYVIHYFVLEDLDFKTSCKKSTNLSKKNKLKDFLTILLSQIFIYVIYLIFIFIGILVIILFNKLFKKMIILESLSVTLVWLLIAISFVILVLLATPISYAIISSLFYKHKKDKNEEIIHTKISLKEKKEASKLFKSLNFALVIIIILSGTLLTNLVLNNKLNLNIEHIRNIEVTAHRGLSKEYPENTMAAFKGAKELKADWIELDVQQTKDQFLVVMHDNNLLRTTGVNKYTYETDYAEIKNLDAGSFFKEEFKDERIPLLEDVISWAKDNFINLNIELKPTGKEKDFEKAVVDLITKYNFENHAVVTSQVYEVLENVKKYNKDIKTVYVMSLAYGDILKLKDADSFSIEASSINNT